MRLTTLLLLGMFGCSEQMRVNESADFEVAAADYSDTGDDGRFDEDAPAEVASHWVMSGNLTHASGVLSTDLSSLEIEIRSASETVLCTGGVGITGSDRITELPDSALQMWWEIRVGEPREGSCLAEELDGLIGGSMWIGLGPLHPEIEAVMSESMAELSSEDFQLRSVFATLEQGQPVWVFGLAVSSHSSQDVESGTGLILPDGQWKFEGVYGFPY